MIYSFLFMLSLTSLMTRSHQSHFCLCEQRPVFISNFLLSSKKGGESIPAAVHVTGIVWDVGFIDIKGYSHSIAIISCNRTHVFIPASENSEKWLCMLRVLHSFISQMCLCVFQSRYTCYPAQQGCQRGKLSFQFIHLGSQNNSNLYL